MRGLRQDLGDSFTPALRMLTRIQRKFAANSEFGVAYEAFLKEYKEFNHMEEIHTTDFTCE